MGEATAGNHLRAFVEEEFFESVGDKVCGKCDEESCIDCEGTLIIGQLENQIAEEGVAFMRQLISDWDTVEDAQRVLIKR